MRAKVAFYIILLGWCLVSVQSLDVCEGQEDGARLAHPKDCSRFIQCQQGETVSIRYCPFGLHFNRYESICDFKFRAGCDFSYALQLVSYNSANELDCETCRFRCSLVASENKPMRLLGGQNSQNSEGEREIPELCLTAPTPKPTSASKPSAQKVPTPCPINLSKPTEPTSCFTNPTTPTDPSEPTPPPIKPSTPTNPTAPTPCPTKSTQTGFTKPAPRPTKPSAQYSTITSTPTGPTAPTPSSPTPSGGAGGNDNPHSPPSTITCTSPGKCAGKRDGTLLADNSSTGYIVCQCECEIKMACPADLVFNAVLQACDWPQ